MLVKTFGAAVFGIDAIVVTVEASVGIGASFTIVGLPDTAVRESYQRVMTATEQSGLRFPIRRVVVNLSPADVRKEGSAFDLPIAVSILAASEIIPADRLGQFMIMGELSLDGTVLPIRGALPMAIKARELGFRAMIVPEANATEGAVVNNLEVYGVSSLRQVADLLAGKSDLQPTLVDTRREFALASSSFDV